jgi:hypothetical protein
VLYFEMLSGVFQVILAFLLLSISLSLLTNEEKSTYDALKEIQQNINAKTSPFCYNAHSGTRQAFISQTYKEFTGHYNVLVYPFCLVTHELGNRLGNYFEEVACAEASGLHFIAVHAQWDLTGSFHGNSTKGTEAQQLAFLRALPDIIVHKQPLDNFHAQTQIKHNCHCTRYCWQHVLAPWVNRTDTLGQYLRTALVAYTSKMNPTDMVTTIDPEVDFTNAKPSQHLPVVPNVAVQYRCGDNIGFSYMYGILPFTAITSRIPPNVKYIYVLSDHPSRAVHSPYTSRCHVILKSFFEFLQEKYPTTTIVVKRGGDLFLDYVRLNQANTTICSASSYCFWPAVSSLGNSYFPLTNLIAGADSMQLAPSFGSRFHWMDEKLISNFKMVKPWTQIIDVLTGKMSY